MTVILTATRTTFFLGSCTPCKRPIRTRDDNATSRYLRLTCPECAQVVTGERLHATINADPCHGQCMSAYGPSCSCSCGGANHGRLWQYQGEETESALMTYRARIAEREAAAATRAQAEQRRRRAAFQQWAQQNTEAVDYLGDGSTFDTLGDNPNDFLYDMARLIARHQPFTDRQAAAVIRCRDVHQRIKARRAEEAANARPVPTGDAVTIRGLVTYVTSEDNRYGPGIRARMLVKGEGFKVWTTIPNALIEAAERMIHLPGRTVQFVATVTTKEDDPTTGYAKRPRKAVLFDTDKSTSDTPPAPADDDPR